MIARRANIAAGIRGSISPHCLTERRARCPPRRCCDAALAFLARLTHPRAMDLDALLQHFFGTDDLDRLTEGEVETGRLKVEIAFGTERDPGRRFALWVVLHALGTAPDPQKAFKDQREREAAIEYARAVDQAERLG